MSKEHTADCPGPVSGIADVTLDVRLVVGERHSSLP